MRTTLRALACAGGLLALCASAAAQDLEASLQAKLAKPFFKNANWHTDFAKAKVAAAKSGTPIFAYFSRSYAP